MMTNAFGESNWIGTSRSRGTMNYELETESSAERGRFGDVGNNIPVKLTKEELKELSSVNSMLACLHVALEWGLVAATIYL
jgi:hypothetical protein